VAKALAERYATRRGAPIREVQQYPINPFVYTRRYTRETSHIGGHQVPRVVADFSQKPSVSAASFFSIGYQYSVPLDKWNISDMACDFVFLGDQPVDFEIPGTLSLIYNYKTWSVQRSQDRAYPLISGEDYLRGIESSPTLNFILARLEDISAALIKKLQEDTTAVLIIETDNEHAMAEQRRIFVELLNLQCSIPVVIRRAYKDLMPDQLRIYSGTDVGGLLVDGLGDGIMISAENCGGDKIVNETAFNILQATRTRISKTEYISCPSCGRTLFDLQETTSKIRSRTNHLKGIKIGIMGCIVNGPGEMADADYGYVGSGPGRITLYRGRDVVKKNVPTAQAVDELIGLIREDGNWLEQEAVMKEQVS
jgi:(E)-4-hydroxy-3-methylbut-2-enyl-diphosphate synthase